MSEEPCDKEGNKFKFTLHGECDKKTGMNTTWTNYKYDEKACAAEVSL